MESSSNFLERIRTGDREAMATLMLKHQSRILRRIRGKLKGLTAIDADDIFSSCVRRLDLMCIDRRLGGMEEDELAGYISRVAMNIATDRVRAELRRRITLHRLWGDSLQRSESSLAEPDEQIIDSLFNQLCDEDRHLLELRLRGLAHIQIANELGISMAAERKRWQRLRASVKAILAPPPRKSETLDGERRAALRMIAPTSSSWLLPFLLSLSTSTIPSAASDLPASRCDPRD